MGFAEGYRRLGLGARGIALLRGAGLVSAGLRRTLAQVIPTSCLVLEETAQVVSIIESRAILVSLASQGRTFLASHLSTRHPVGRK